MSRDKPERLSIEAALLTIGIVAARYNSDLVDVLVQRTVATLLEAGVNEDSIETIRVPGSHEVPFALSRLAESGQFDCLIGLGVVVAGETSHADVICHSTSQAIQMIGMNSGIPVIYGILGTETRAQAEERCLGPIDRGAEFAAAALEMVSVNQGIGDRWLGDLVENSGDLISLTENEGGIEGDSAGHEGSGEDSKPS